ncbi:MAG: hypothetical protein ACYTFG_11660 [Planctomycetota bacterium]|jgi:hypothetical protein
MKIERLAEAQYRISDGERSVEFDQERFEDLFYAVPVDSTAFYRLLTEAVCETEGERGAMVAMINGLSDMDSGLKGVQDQVTGLGAK